MTRTRALLLACAVAASLYTAGVPAGADQPKEQKKEQKQRSPYAGHYTGTFTASTPGGDQEGELTLTVDEEGNSTGEALNKTVNQKSTLKGTLLKDNKSVLVIDFGNNAKANAYGTISKTDKGGITGTMIQRVGNQVVGGIEFELTPKPKDEAKKE